MAQIREDLGSVGRVRAELCAGGPLRGEGDVGGDQEARNAVSVLDHIGFEVSDLERSAHFYDAVFQAIGGRRLYADPETQRVGDRTQVVNG